MHFISCQFLDNPSTWPAVAVDDTVTSWGVTQAGVAGACAFNGEAYMIGGNPDALYRFERDVGPLSIEAIDEQIIPIFTEDYVLEIDIGGEPDRAYVDGDMEGFYHEWDPDNAKIRIKAIRSNTADQWRYLERASRQRYRNARPSDHLYRFAGCTGDNGPRCANLV